MKLKVVPDPSERCTTAMPVEGRVAEGFSFLIAGSSQVLISPRKILASVGPSNTRSPGLTPSMFTTGTMPPITIGHCTRPAALRSSGFSGLSVAPKVTVRALICLMPPPEPIDW